MKLLLDHNVPRKLKEVLTRLGISCQTALELKWDKLENGALAAKAIENHFDGILTRDRRFQKSAASTLKNANHFSIVLLVLRQSDAATYCAEFEKAWRRSPISLLPGRLIEWPLS